MHFPKGKTVTNIERKLCNEATKLVGYLEPSLKLSIQETEGPNGSHEEDELGKGTNQSTLEEGRGSHGQERH